MAVLGYLGLESLDACELGLGTGHTDELDLDELAVELLVEVEDMGLDILLKNSHCEHFK